MLVAPSSSRFKRILSKILTPGDRLMRRARSFDEGRFSDLLGVLSTRLATIPHHKISGEVSAWLEQVCRLLGLDRSVLAEYLPERRDFYTTYQWTGEGSPPAPGPLARASDFLPWVSAKGATGEIVIVPSIEALPPEANVDRNFMLGQGPKAILGVPLFVGNRLVAGLTFEDMYGARQWSSSLLPRLKLVGDIFGNALERKRVAAEMSGLKEQAQRSARLALAGEMVAAMAHELSHPLGAILANAQAARRLLETPHLSVAELQETLDDVISAERRAAAYVEKVRSVFRRSELHTEPLQVDRVINSAASLTRGVLLARGITLETQIDRKLPPVAADRVGIEQVMLNLIQNAADAVSENKHSIRRVIVRAFQRDSRFVVIAVTDTGIGIDKRHLQQIFEPLFTTKPKGTGMGLAIVRSIVKSHGGQVCVHSEVGHGATFELSFPVAEAS